MRRVTPIWATVLGFVAGTQASGATLTVAVQRLSPDHVAVRWQDERPVDIFVSDRPDAVPSAAHRLAGSDREGKYDYSGSIGRPYFIVRDGSGAWARTAEREVQLQQGSNFRDVGGYPAAGGKHVRWGMIYRSAATPLLTDADVATVKALGIHDLVDLRSNEERALAPSRPDGIRYSAIGYSMSTIAERSKETGPNGGTIGIYRDFPTMLAPQLRIVFEKLTDRKGATAYNCSAGQDRTGFVTAMVLYALGVPRDVIDSDYLLSTQDRRPEYEMPRIDLAAHPNDPAAALFARSQQGPQPRKPTPLFDARHRPYIETSFDEIIARWGSVDAYLREEAGVGPVERAILRRNYLE